MLGTIARLRTGGAALALAVAIGGQALAGVTTELVSVGPGGVLPNGLSTLPSISADGSAVAFQSAASNLVTGDSNNQRDVFVRDRRAGTTTRVSVRGCAPRTKLCIQGDRASVGGAISAGGRYIAFESDATNLVSSDTNNKRDVFVRDLQTSTTTRVSLNAAGVQGNKESSGPSISADGRFVAFLSVATNLVPGGASGLGDVFIRDRQNGTTMLVSAHCTGGGFCTAANSYSLAPAISADGRFVAFRSYASNLVSGDTNNHPDVFVFDRTTHAIQRVSLGIGSQANGDSYEPQISADGRFVTFASFASNLVPGDSNGKTDVFIFDRQTTTTKRVSVITGGGQANDHSNYGTISTDGRFAAFESDATNLVTGDTNHRGDVFIRDRVLGLTTRASVSLIGTQGSGQSLFARISADGHVVAFASYADDLVIGGGTGIFVHTVSP